MVDKANKDAKGLPLTVRSVYVLKPDKTVALTMAYPASTGRNFDEILRVIDSLQLTAEKFTATPADWKHGEDGKLKLHLTRRGRIILHYCFHGIWCPYSSVYPTISPSSFNSVIVNFPLTDAMADETFGKGGYRIVEVPSEKGKDIPKHYLRYTKDPSVA